MRSSRGRAPRPALYVSTYVLVYRGVPRGTEAFHAGHDRAFPPQLEAAVVAPAVHRFGGFAGDVHLLPLLPQVVAIGGEVLARGVFAIPFGGVKQHGPAR